MSIFIECDFARFARHVYKQQWRLRGSDFAPRCTRIRLASNAVTSVHGRQFNSYFFLNGRSNIPGFGQCPELRPLAESEGIICHAPPNKPDHCDVISHHVHTNCRMFETCDQAVIVSGAWNRCVYHDVIKLFIVPVWLNCVQLVYRYRCQWVVSVFWYVFARCCQMDVAAVPEGKRRLDVSPLQESWLHRLQYQGLLRQWRSWHSKRYVITTCCLA